MIGVEITGVKELLAGFDNYKKEVGKAVARSVTTTTASITKDAKERLKSGLQSNPKHTRTGRLASSIMRKKQHERDPFEGVVGTNVEYAPYIEFGTGEQVFTNSDFDENARLVALDYKGYKKTKGMIGVSFLNFAALKNTKTFIEALTKNLNKIVK
jgi:HK97 gp10 family phage protein